jgi:copper chaperone
MPTVKIKGMSCGHCVASVTAALEKIPGVSEVAVSLEKGEASYTATPDVSAEAVATAIRAIGFTAE